MATGFCPYLLQAIGEITKDANPMFKIQPNGFTGMLMTASTPGLIKNDSYNGHYKTVQVKKRQRFTVRQTDTTESCDNVNIPAYSEDTVSVANIRQLAFHIDDETIAKYCDDASSLQTPTGMKPMTGLMKEVLETVMSAANALLQGVDQDLLGLLTFGFNKTTNLNTAKTINLPLTVTTQPLNNGITELLADYKKNGLTGRPQIVGQGFMLNYTMQQIAKGLDQYGLDSSILTSMYDFWNDDNYEGVFGSNQFGMFEPNSLQIVEYLRYQGYKAGAKPGGSTFGILPLPMYVGNSVQPVLFDFQWKYYDCATTLTDAYTGQSVSVQKGWSMILSKQFGLYQIPFDAYRGDDPNYRVTGALRYVATNA